MKALLLVALAALAAACASPRGLTTTGSTLDPSSLSAQRTLAEAAPGGPLAADWWKGYGDNQLDALVGEALAAHPSLQVAQARIAQARAAAATAHLALAPTARASVSSSRQRLSENGLVPPPFGGRWIWQNQAMLEVDYELDPWGRNRKAYEAALGQVRAAQIDADAAKLTLETAIVRAYLAFAAGFEQRDLARAAVAQREAILAITRARVDAGLDSELELRQAEGGVPAAREQVLAAEETVTLARDQLAALAGAGPDRGLALARPSIRVPAVALPSRLPADLLGRRPDVIAQRLRIEAAVLEIESARAAFYPNLDLAAFIGLQSLDFERFLRPGSYTAGIGPALRLPFFERGRLRAALQTRQADWDLQVAQYNQTLVEALREVVDQVATMRAIDARLAQNAAALEAAERAHGLALERYRAGTGNYLQALAAEDQVLAQRNARLDLRVRSLDAQLALIRAVGGGYEPPAATAALAR